MNEYVVKGDNKLTVGIGWDAKKVDLKKKIKIAIDNIMSATSRTHMTSTLQRSLSTMTALIPNWYSGVTSTAEAIL